MAKVSYARNPYPVPDVSREGVWIQGPVLGDKVAAEDKDWGSKVKAHERLFAHHTLTSIRKDQRLVRTKVPKDALDLTLTAVYEHSKDTLVPKVYVPMQPETIGKKTWRVLRNEIEVDYENRSQVSPKSSEQVSGAARDSVSILLAKSECYHGPVVERRIHPSNVKLNISGPHMVQSNPGYSRKIDGTFYSI